MNLFCANKKFISKKWFLKFKPFSFFILPFLFFVCYFLFLIPAVAQIPETFITQQQLEYITENNSDAEIQDDSFLQQIEQYKKHPINLNTASENDLKQLHLLNELQIENFFNYRNLFGKFINIYELQAIPLWNINSIKKMLLYVTVSDDIDIAASLKERFSKGENSFLSTLSQTAPKAKGYFYNPTANYYLGSPLKIFTRYKYQFKNLLQYGLLAKKDAGEQFFKGSQKQGFDFYSAHFFIKNLGKIQSLAIGDFTVNMGQGLIQWQSLAFKKSANVIDIKREADILRPYNSAGEINFHRGLGITYKIKNIMATMFVSYKKIDGNFIADTSQNQQDYISSLQTTGYHRTQSEIDDKGVQRQLAFGANVFYKHKKFTIGLNGIQYKFKLPLHKSADPYNLYAPNGKNFSNYSVDYSYTLKNIHFFGEAAINNKMYKAFINGMLISLTAHVDMSFLYRNISSGYQSFYSSAFTENAYPTNEKGFYTGISIRTNNLWQIDAFADFYKFPWLKYLVNAPSIGTDYLLQISYHPNKFFEIQSRYTTQTKQVNDNPNFLVLSPVVAQPKQNWCTQFNYVINKQITLNSRVAVDWFNKNTPAAEQGFLTYFDIFYQHKTAPFGANLRLQYFETNSYNSRLYAYENDVLFSYSIPIFFDKGIRYYINISYRANKKAIFCARWAQTIYKDKTLIGTGLDAINGNKKTEIKLQIVYNF